MPENGQQLVTIARLSDAQVDRLARLLSLYTRGDDGGKRRQLVWQSKFTAFAATTTAKQMLASDSRRRALLVGNPLSNNVIISLDPSPQTNGGWNLTTTNTPFEVNVNDHGDLPSRTWFAVAQVGGATIGIIEVLDMS